MKDQTDDVKGFLVFLGVIVLTCFWFSSSMNWQEKQYETRIEGMIQKNEQQLRQELEQERAYSSGLREGALLIR